MRSKFIKTLKTKINVTFVNKFNSVTACQTAYCICFMQSNRLTPYRHLTAVYFQIRWEEFGSFSVKSEDKSCNC